MDISGSGTLSTHATDSVWAGMQGKEGAGKQYEQFDPEAVSTPTVQAKPPPTRVSRCIAGTIPSRLATEDENQPHPQREQRPVES